MSRPPEAGADRARNGRRLRSLARRDPRKPLTVVIVYRGGPECWWEIRARGVVLRRPGVAALHDVLQELDGGRSS